MPPRSALTRAALVFGGAHAAVDACTVSSVYRCIEQHRLEQPDAFALVVAYGLLAFVSQSLVGLLADRRGSYRPLVRAGLLLSAVGVLAVPVHPLLVLAAAGAGNALFHVGAGAVVLTRGPDRAGPIGLFVGPGALGLGFGMWYGLDATLGSLLPLVVALAVASAAVELFALPTPAPARPVATRPPLAVSLRSGAALLGMLFAAVAVRSYVGAGAPSAVPRVGVVIVALSLIACAGKMVGGLLADRFGWRVVATGALLAATPLLAFGGADPALVLPGLLLFQIPMPIVVVGVLRLLPGRPAFAFGVNCLALILGALPTFYAWGTALYGPSTFLTLALLATAAVWFALSRSADVRGAGFASAPTSVHASPAVPDGAASREEISP